MNFKTYFSAVRVSCRFIFIISPSHSLDFSVPLILLYWAISLVSDTYLESVYDFSLMLHDGT